MKERKESLKKLAQQPDKKVWSLPEVIDLGVPSPTLYIHLKKGILNAQDVAGDEKAKPSYIMTTAQVKAYLSGKNVPQPEFKVVGYDGAAQILGISRSWTEKCIVNGRLSSWTVQGRGGMLRVFGPDHLTLDPASKYAGVLEEDEDTGKYRFVADGENGRLYNKVYAQRLATERGLV